MAVRSLLAYTTHADLNPLRDSYTLLQARNLSDFEQACLHQRPLLVLLDDLALCARYRAQILAPILLFLDDSQFIDAAFAAGADDCLIMPVHPRLLKQHVDSLVRQDSYAPYQDLPIMMHSVNRNLELLFVNQQWLATLGYTWDEVIGLPITHFMSKEQVAQLEARDENFWEAGQVRNVRASFIHKTGQSIDVLLDSDLQEGRNGKPISITLARDVSLLSQRENELRESEKRYRRLFEAANDGIILIDIQTAQIVEANPQISRMLGYSRDEITGLALAEVEMPSPQSGDENSTDLSLTHRLIIESQYKRHDGTVIPVETSSRIITYQDRPTIICFVRDITERKRALAMEHEQRQLAETLRDTAAAFNHSLTLDEVLDTLIANVERIASSDSGNIMFIEEGMTRIVRHRGYEQAGFDASHLETIQFKVDEVLNLRIASITHQPYIIYETQEKSVDWQDEVTSQWVRSLITAPIVIEDTVIGFINLDGRKPNQFTEEQGQRLKTFTDQAAIAIHKAQLFEQVQDYAMTLEERIAERTTALLDANRALKEQVIQRQEAEEKLEAERNLLQSLIDTIPDGIYIKDRESRFVLANAATLQTQNMPSLAALVGKSDADFVPKEYAERFRQTEVRIMNTGEPMVNFHDIYVDDGGSTFHSLITKVPLRDTHGNIIGIIGLNHDITELTETEAQLEQVLTSARCLLWYATVQQVGTDFYWDLRIANEQAAQVFLPMDLSKQTYSEAWQASILPEDSERRRYVFRTHLTFNKLNYSQEFRSQSANGKIHWLVEDVQIRSIGKQKWRLVGVCTDISQRKHAEERLTQINEELERRVQERTERLVHANDALQQEITERRKAEESERQQRLFAEALRDVSAVLNSSLQLNTVLEHILDAMDNVLHYDAANIMLIQGMDAKIVRARGYDLNIVGQVFDLKEATNLYHCYTTGDPYIIADVSTYTDWVDTDTEKWVRSNLVAPIPLHDSIIGFLIVDSSVRNGFSAAHAEGLQAFANQAGIAIRNARMLEEIRQYALDLEERVEKRTAELAYERAQLQAILDAMRDGVVLQDLEHKPIYINRAMTAITGYNEAEWLSGLAQAQMNISSPEAMQSIWQRVDEILKRQGYWEGESEVLHKDGHRFDISLVRTAVRDLSGERIGMVTVLRDISQAKRLEQQKSRFIASASHELRTPIANMKTRLFLIRRRPEKLEEHLQVISSVVDLMQNLVETMFDVSRFERGVIKLEREDLILQELVKEVLLFHEPEAERKNIRLEKELPELPISLSADSTRLMQVITNLVKNALNYTPSDGFILVKVNLQVDEAQIEVRDTGEGIPPENISQLFTPFFRGRTDNLGTGLGLSISHEIVKLHGGDIVVESEVGKGSRFIVRLPLQKIPTPLETQ